MALNLMRYDNSTSWNMVNLCVLSFIHGKHVSSIDRICLCFFEQISFGVLCLQYLLFLDRYEVLCRPLTQNLSVPQLGSGPEDLAPLRHALRGPCHGHLDAEPAVIQRAAPGEGLLKWHQMSKSSSHSVSRLLRIIELASHTFAALTNLRSLDLSGNHLALIHPEALSIPGSPLQELNLSRSLHNFTALTDLVTALRWGRLWGLLHLDLSGNLLALVPPGMFSHVPNLQQLWLRNNSLVAVYAGTFSGMDHLEMLDLTHNAFEAFRAGALQELERLGNAQIFLGNNPYICSCEIRDFVTWLNKSKAQVDVDSVRCASPEELANTRLQGLTVQAIGCVIPVLAEVTDLTLGTSYVFLGLVLGFVGMVFLFVLYLNRNGMKKWIIETRDACREVLEGYHYRYEIDSDPRLGHITAKPFGTNAALAAGAASVRDFRGSLGRERNHNCFFLCENKNGRSRGHPQNGTARKSETIGFIPGSADSTPASRPTCGSCASMGWSGCKALICCVLTCGFYGSREPCLPVNESSTDHPPKAGSETSNGMALANPTCGVSVESSRPTKTTKLPPSESFRYQDVRFRGEIVNYPVNPSKRTRPPAKGESQRPISNTSLLSDCYDLDDPCDSTDVDSLITKKLLELYALHQIEELAKCTSDSSFFRKTNEISELIYNIAQNYNLEEQEAECKLVHGVIRISTRKAKKKASHQSAGQRPNGRNDGTLPDSGNETMTQTFMSSDCKEFPTHVFVAVYKKCSKYL
ncbi:hypothetical protein XENOCAPTIV_007675 [Xenoophorus captivus]|uniref:LRRCT domain-containing protein n=1 Tax=Xenoophorus captivus TaxID=1517983 RepID=A0ABV0RU62_9TELE